MYYFSLRLWLHQQQSVVISHLEQKWKYFSSFFLKSLFLIYLSPFLGFLVKLFHMIPHPQFPLPNHQLQHSFILLQWSHQQPPAHIVLNFLLSKNIFEIINNSQKTGTSISICFRWLIFRLLSFRHLNCRFLFSLSRVIFGLSNPL